MRLAHAEGQPEIFGSKVLDADQRLASVVQHGFIQGGQAPARHHVDDHVAGFAGIADLATERGNSGHGGRGFHLIPIGSGAIQRDQRGPLRAANGAVKKAGRHEQPVGFSSVGDDEFSAMIGVGQRAQDECVTALATCGTCAPAPADQRVVAVTAVQLAIEIGAMLRAAGIDGTRVNRIVASTALS